MRNPTRSHRNTPRPNPMLGSLSVDQYLSFQHDYGLVQIWVGVKRGRLALHQPILEQNERPVGLLSGRLHGEHASAGEPEALALSLPPNDRPCTVHSFLLLTCTFGAPSSWWDVVYHNGY